MGRIIRYSDEVIQILSSHPCIKHIKHNRLTFTYDFRMKLYEAWELNPSLSTLRKVMKAEGLDPTLILRFTLHGLEVNFKRNGRPSNGTNKVFGISQSQLKITIDANERLLQSGMFIKNRRGVSFHPDLIHELYSKFPATSIEDALMEAGINPEDVGYQRIRSLKKRFGNVNPTPQAHRYDSKVIETMKDHPYVKKITAKQFVLTDAFFNESYLFIDSLHIHDILNLFEIDPSSIDIGALNRMRFKLMHWTPVEQFDTPNTHLNMQTRIQMKRFIALNQVIEDGFQSLKKMVPTLNQRQRKKVCQWIQSVPSNPKKTYTISCMLKNVGISRSHYYHMLKTLDYGEHEANKNRQDDIDIGHIRTVIDYKGYAKGSRMITMMMPAVTGQKMGRGKVLRLMKKYDIQTEVRKGSNARKSSRELIERNRKPNILRRQFRLSRPLTTLCSDVSYLKYGLNHTAYLSVIKDSSSGRTPACVVSDSNNLRLAMDTLEPLRNCELNDAALIHTDQGILYLTEEYQAKVKELGLTQSMSRRGNCWDNASQESFFGHFKDECDYQNCETLEELQEVVNDYIDYYNNERPQWTRMKMTPVEFEAYLLNMSDEEFEAYYKEQYEKYQAMMDEATRKAKQRIVEMQG